MVESIGNARAGVEPVEPELVDELVQVSFAVTAVLSRVGARHDLSLTQIRMLGILRDREIGVTELAGHLGLEKSTVSGLVDRATRRGLLERTTDPADGRAVRLRLAPAGRQFAHEAETTVGTLLAPLVGDFTTIERRRLTELLSRVARTSA